MSLTFTLDDEALEPGRTRINLEWETEVNTALSEIFETLNAYIADGYILVRITAEYRKDR